MKESVFILQLACERTFSRCLNVWLLFSSDTKTSNAEPSFTEKKLILGVRVREKNHYSTYSVGQTTERQRS